MKQNYVKKFVALTAIIGAMSMGMTVNAEPRMMEDGVVFDAEYYADMNEDVRTVLGSDENVLYQHYLAFGKTEGRKPVADSDEKVSEVSVSQTLSIEEAVEIWDDFWQSGYLNLDDKILAYFDEDGDYFMNEEETDNLYLWVCYENDTNKENNTLTSFMGEDEIIAAATKIKQGYLTTPDKLFKAYYVDGIWIIG